MFSCLSTSELLDLGTLDFRSYVSSMQILGSLDFNTTLTFLVFHYEKAHHGILWPLQLCEPVSIIKYSLILSLHANCFSGEF